MKKMTTSAGRRSGTIKLLLLMVLALEGSSGWNDALVKPTNAKYINGAHDNQRATVGKGSSIHSRYIVGGEQAAVGEFPWQVALLDKTANSSGPAPPLVCGGSIIDENWILTAAHCFQFLKPDQLVVKVGTNDLCGNGLKVDCSSSTSNTYALDECDNENKQDNNGVSVHNIEKVMIHPNFTNEMLIINDIALIKLSKPIAFGEHVKKIDLPTQDYGDEFSLKKTATLSGWGRISSTSTSEECLLRKVELPIVDSKKCQEMLDIQDPFDAFEWKNHICAGGQIGFDACFGDSGGPLQVQIDEEQQQGVAAAAGYGAEHVRTTSQPMKWILAGLASGGFNNKGCGQENKPNFYTRVSKYMDWISSTMAPTATK